MLALPPPFVLQWERECTADALLSAAQPASEQCIGLMQCSCVLTHSTSPPPVCLLLPPLTVSIFSSLLLSLPLCFFRPLHSFLNFTLPITLPVLIFPSTAFSTTTTTTYRQNWKPPIPMYHTEIRGQTFYSSFRVVCVFCPSLSCEFSSVPVFLMEMRLAVITHTV